MGELHVADHRQMLAISAGVDANAVLAQVRAIQTILNGVMKDGTHYGVIVGCKQPSLYKAGSEVLLSAFKIAVEPEVTEIRDGNHITAKVRCIGRHMASGIVIGVGVGECSTAEDKYAWRAAVCDQEWDATPETHRRDKYSKGKWDNNSRSYGAPIITKQVRTNPADLANTILKMAKKRAQVDLCLTALAASDIFTQDIEDLPDEYVESNVRNKHGDVREKDISAPVVMYPSDSFKEKLPVWQKLIAEGKDAEKVIAQIESKGKLTDAQKAEIRSAKPKPTEAKGETE